MDYLDLSDGLGSVTPAPAAAPAERAQVAASDPLPAVSRVIDPPKPERPSSALNEVELAFAGLVLPRINRVVYQTRRPVLDEIWWDRSDDQVNEHYSAVHHMNKTGVWPTGIKSIGRLSAEWLADHLRDRKRLAVRSDYMSGYTLVRIDVDAHEGQTDGMEFAQHLKGKLGKGYICPSDNGVSVYVWLLNPGREHPYKQRKHDLSPDEVLDYVAMLKEEGYGRMLDRCTEAPEHLPRLYAGRDINAIVRQFQEKLRKITADAGFTSDVEVMGGVVVADHARDHVIESVELAARTINERGSAAKLPHCKTLEDIKELAAAELTIPDLMRMFDIKLDTARSVTKSRPARRRKSSEPRTMVDKGSTCSNTCQALTAAMIQLGYRNAGTTADAGSHDAEQVVALAMDLYAKIPGRDSVHDKKRLHRFRSAFRMLLRNRDESKIAVKGSAVPSAEIWFEEKHIAEVEQKLRSTISRQVLNQTNASYKSWDKLTYRNLAIIACTMSKNIVTSAGHVPVLAVRRLLEHARHLGREVSGSMVAAGFRLLESVGVVRCIGDAVRGTAAQRGECRTWQLAKRAWFSFLPAMPKAQAPTADSADGAGAGKGHQCPHDPTTAPFLSQSSTGGIPTADSVGISRKGSGITGGLSFCTLPRHSMSQSAWEHCAP